MYWPWEPTATLPSAGAAVGSAARGASAPIEGGDGRSISWRPPSYSLLNKLWGRPPHNAPAPPLQVDLWPFELGSGVRVTCEVGYLCAIFSLPRPLCSRLRPDVRDRQMSDVRQAWSLNAPTIGAGHNKVAVFRTLVLHFSVPHFHVLHFPPLAYGSALTLCLTLSVDLFSYVKWMSDNVRLCNCGVVRHAYDSRLVRSETVFTRA